MDGATWNRSGHPQAAFLFSGTVASNLRYGDEAATDDALWHALEIAQGREFVAEMEGGLDAPITQGGMNVSGGQRQRLAIARALVKRAGIYIFDDSFSALDFTTDARLRAALDRELGWATVIIVAQRVGTIMHADRILVMDSGRIVGMGTHTELLAGNETYARSSRSCRSGGRGVSERRERAIGGTKPVPRPRGAHGMMGMGMPRRRPGLGSAAGC
jgi:ABC-type multidrug transport system fused ATPase/permease subunit